MPIFVQLAAVETLNRGRTAPFTFSSPPYCVRDRILLQLAAMNAMDLDIDDEDFLALLRYRDLCNLSYGG